MDPDFLPNKVLADDGTHNPAAGKALRELNGWGSGEWKHSPAVIFKVKCPRINDPAGLIRSASDRRSGPGMRNSYA